ncbi:rod shape-determining protein MreC [Terriglobus roseus]|uniref:Cell shape-determining protein MreC n=1 Tax=Terriglobus roseus TaxID=392734 RepID=A0A1G7FJP9_9BACT|nr:rod shape-determining protein MreC [Terriglobus roseus]SDE76117.1 rod shape-determining protein MreC [Terriglobus roseus]
MESFFSRFKSALVLVAVLLAQVIGLASQMKRLNYAAREDGHHVRGLRAWPAYTIAPVESLLKHMGGGVRGVWHSYIDLRHVRQHDKDLQYQIDQLRVREASLAEDARQGQRLQRLLAFKQQYVGKTVAAQVIGTGGGDQGRVVTIDKGSNDGIRPDMAVITPDGAVGKVRDVFAMSSQVLLLNDMSSGAGVILLNTRSRGILRGGPGGTLLINNLLPDERIKAGEPLITSGGDRVYPRGLPVGNVIYMKPDPDHQPYAAIAIKPAANLDRLEEVLVVTEVSQQLNTATDDDQEEGKKAAEVVADRLPGLKKADEKNGDENAATSPAPTLPRPQPAIHTDRYSPGAAPPASSLTPGAPNTQLATPPQRSTSTPNAPEEP